MRQDRIRCGASHRAPHEQRLPTLFHVLHPPLALSASVPLDAAVLLHKLHAGEEGAPRTRVLRALDHVGGDATERLRPCQVRLDRGGHAEPIVVGEVAGLPGCGTAETTRPPWSGAEAI